MKAKLAKMVVTWPLPECGKQVSDVSEVSDETYLKIFSQTLH